MHAGDVWPNGAPLGISSLAAEAAVLLTATYPFPETIDAMQDLLDHPANNVKVLISFWAVRTPGTALNRHPERRCLSHEPRRRRWKPQADRPTHRVCGL